MNLEELRELDPNDPGSWPILLKGIVVAVLMAAVLFMVWNFDTKKQNQELDRVRAEEPVLKQTFEAKQVRAANLDILKQQLIQIRESFGDLLQQLPNRAEMEALLVDISQTGLAAGLEITLFRPATENKFEFYAELPVEMRMIGSYHQFGEFISGVSNLQRIVTTHDIKIKKLSGAEGLLEMNTFARTYRALETEEEEEVIEQ